MDKALSQQIGDSVWDSVGDSVGASVWASVRDSVGASVRASVWASGYGSHDAPWLAFYRYFHDVCGLVEQTRALAGMWEIAESAGWWLPHEHICWVSERHNVLRLDDRGRLHSDNGPACAYPDGWGVYAWHGLRLPPGQEWIVDDPDRITPETIMSEDNAEIKRVMVERMGYERFVSDLSAERVHHDDTGTLWRKDLGDDRPPITLVEVLDGTPDAVSGERRRYWLRVPPEMQTARQAVAWSFYETPESYTPEVET
jgi:hypothetical protein